MVVKRVVCVCVCVHVDTPGCELSTYRLSPGTRRPPPAHLALWQAARDCCQAKRRLMRCVMMSAALHDGDDPPLVQDSDHGCVHVCVRTRVCVCA